MAELNFYKIKGSLVNFTPLNIKRDWMDETFDKHAYRCLPVSLGNLIGWTFSYPEEISFIWDGISDSFPDHVKVLSGEKYVLTGRANATLSFHTDLYLRTDSNISLLIMPVPNQFIEGVQCFTTVISPSVLKSPIPAAWKITTANKVITIPANTPIASIIPISLKDLENTNVNLYIENFNKEHHEFLKNYGEGSRKKAEKEIWTNFYRDAVDHQGNKIGEHELKKLRLEVNDFTGNKNENKQNNI